MIEGAARVIDLLTYIEQVEKLKAKPAFIVPVEYFAAYQHELKGLPELKYNLQSDGDDIWLKLPRLQEISAPDLNEKLKPWVTLSKSADKSPELKEEVILFDGKAEVARLKLGEHPEIKELFDWYVENQWEPWAIAERPRRKTISFYNKLFSLQQAIESEGAETPLELVWGLGFAAWKKDGFASTLRHPLLVQACEVSLNPKTFDIEVRPRDLEPRIELDTYAAMELPGVTQLEAFWKSHLTTAASRVNPFEESTFEGVLRAAVGHLDPTGAYAVKTDDVTPPAPSNKLIISNTWVLFGRKRSGDVFLEDIRRLKKNVEAASALPPVIRSFVEAGDSEVRVRAEIPFRGLSTSDGHTGARELYFPMPYNDEQVSIIQKLESNDGVVVQGPPGTGKTHTIANVICHYLAQGKRVLVTAKGESALAVLQEKLPERIRPLSVGLLSDERDGMKQFEHAIQAIASSVAALNPARAAAAIATAEASLNQLHAKISHVDRSISEHAGKHMRSYLFKGRESTPEEIAKFVMSEADEHRWLDDDLPATPEDEIPFEEGAISALRQARIRAGADLSYLGRKLPVSDEFPAWVGLKTLHKDLLRAKAIESSITQGNVLNVVDSKFETFEKAQELQKFLDARLNLKTRVAGANQAWTTPFTQRLRDLQPSDPVLEALKHACEEVRQLEAVRRELLPKAIDVPVSAELNEDFRDSVERQVAGKSAFAFPFGKGDARKLIGAVTVLGVAPAGKDDWALVQRLADWRINARKALARWNSMSTEFGFDAPGIEIESGFRKAFQWESLIGDVSQLVYDFDAKLHPRIAEVFGKATADSMWDKGEPFVSEIFKSLQAHIDKSHLAYTMKQIGELVRKLEGKSGPIVEALRDFLTQSLGQVDADEARLQNTWSALQADLVRLNSLQPELEVIERTAAAIEAKGARNWAVRIRRQVAEADNDPVIPAKWLEAWNWRKAYMFLENIDGHHTLRELFEQRRSLTTTLARTYQELVAEKTWLGVYNNSPEAVRQALQSYLTSIQSMSQTGRGIRDVRHRRNAREAMTKAYKAVPCWVMPQWRVSEAIPAEVGLFDLVIIDEASQSDIWALPALLRGKKLLVVGDHKQVSPSAVGLAEQKIQELTQRFLGEQPFGAQMTPERSIYDLARVVFAGNSVMLKEHFRCVPAIIEYSNREFYEGEIKPLRLPRANERLDPPLIDVYVKGGYRKGDINPTEAKAIVDEIKSILADERMAGRTIGVVTLMGTEQANHIHELVHEQIPPYDIVNRKIAVGPPPVFQGRERDIMMVSMVLVPGNGPAANRMEFQQRFNVALSRARDRMYLFRSVMDTAFGEDSLNARLIRHFRQPFRQDVRKVEALRERCESGFEQEMFDELVKRGYRVEPQVPCAGYRIDFVVEGKEGRRLAIECDGDRFHGPAQWSDDMARQRVLERAGWTFWRCFASSFVRRRQAVLEDLVQALDGLGVEPLGAESVDNSVWVHYKEVDPFAVEVEEENDLDKSRGTTA